jgi:hypothetical protein
VIPSAKTIEVNRVMYSKGVMGRILPNRLSRL